MRNYLEVCKKILDQGVRRSNRTGIDTIGIHSEMLRFDMDDGFPAVTTKKLAFNTVAAELLGFMRGYGSADRFRGLGCNIWDANANDNRQWLDNPNRRGEDDLGRIYGVQARQYRKFRFKRVHADSGSAELVGHIDQLQKVVDDLKAGIDDRREIVTHWNPAEMDQMSLPPCHLLYQFGIGGKDSDRLHLAVYQRSADFPLGVPFDIASYALLLHIVARLTGLKPGELSYFFFDCHVYVNQIDALRVQLERPTFALPELRMNDNIKELWDVDNWVLPSDFQLEGYQHHPRIDYPMAV